MERAQLVPSVGVDGKVGGGSSRSFGANRSEARKIGGPCLTPDVEQRERRSDMRRGTKANENPRTFLAPRKQAGIAENLEMTRHPWLTLSEDKRKFANGKLEPPHERNDA